MLQAALEAGLHLAEFWAATPRETYAAVKAYHRRRGWQAWHAAYLGRVKDLPALERLTGDELPDREPMDPEALLGAVRAIRERLKQRKA